VSKPNLLSHLETFMTMKNFLLKITALLLISLSGSAQDMGKSQIEVSYGVFSNEELAYDLINKVIDVFASSDNQPFKKRSGSVFVTYKYFTLERLAFGATTGYNKYERTDYFTNGNFVSHQNKTLTVSGEANFYYLKTGGISLYVMGGMGYFHTHSAITSTGQGPIQGKLNGVAIQITPVGIRYGKSFGGFAELGLGYKGMVNFGVNVKF
jgi:hypothetical protein